MSFTQFTNLDFDQIKSSIKDYLRTNSTFTDFDFEGSNLSILIDILAYNTYITAYNTNMVANESFLDSATIRENVVSLVRNIGYLPLSRRSAKANISFPLAELSSTTRTATLKAGIICTGDQDNSNYIFSVPEDITVPVSNGTCIFSDIDVYEGSFLSKTFTVNTSQPNQKYILPNSYIDTSTIRVNVRTSQTSTTTEEYIAVDNITNINSSSQIFLIQEVSDEKYEIFFGDGIFGKKLENQNYITITYITSNGKEGNGISNFTFSGTIIDNFGNNISGKIGLINTNNASQNGDDIQSIESIRYYAPRLYASQYRAVTTSDYEALIPSIYPNIESVTAYGGEELIPPQYGKVFLAAKPKNSDYLSDITKENILKSLKKYSIAGISAKFVDISVLYIELDSVVYYNSNFVGSVNDLQTKVISSLNALQNSTDLNKFGGRFKYSKALRIIDTTSTSITSNITKVKIRRNVTAILNLPTNYLVCFENKFHVSDNGYNIRSTGFYIQGNTNQLYISDVPDSSLKTGKLFLFYFVGKDVNILSENIGRIDYDKGLLNIDNINVVSTTKPNNIIEIEAMPDSNDILAKKSVYLKLDVGSSKIIMEKDIVASGENSSASRFNPESSYTKETKIRI